MNKPEMRSWMTGCCSPVLTTSLPNSGSDSDLWQRDLINERKRKRLESNRESARRSRMKKQKHVDDLKAQLVQLVTDNRQIAAEIAVTTEHYVKIEAENSIMRAQLTELNHCLNSLNDLLRFAGYSSSAGGVGMKTGPSAAGAFGTETGHSATGGFGMETGQGGGVTDYGGGGGGDGFYGGGGERDGLYGGGGGDGFYDGMMNPLTLGFYNQTPNMTFASAGVGDVLNCW